MKLAAAWSASGLGSCATARPAGPGGSAVSVAAGCRGGPAAAGPSRHDPASQALNLSVVPPGCTVEQAVAAVTAQHLVGFSTLARPGPLCNTKSHFNHDRSSGNLRAFNLKKLKLSPSPSPQWPAAGGRQQASSSVRQTKGRTIWNLGSLLYSTFFGYIPPWLYSTSQTAI